MDRMPQKIKILGRSFKRLLARKKVEAGLILPGFAGDNNLDTYKSAR